MVAQSGDSNAQRKRRHDSRANEDQNRGRRWRSEELLAGAREVVIEHRGESYRLRETASGKLILTK